TRYVAQLLFSFLSSCYGHHHDLRSFPTRRSSDLTDRVAVLDDGVRRIRVWRRADDPALPGLRSVLDPAVVARWLGATDGVRVTLDRKSTRLNSSHVKISYAVFCLKKKNTHFSSIV